MAKKSSSYMEQIISADKPEDMAALKKEAVNYYQTTIHNSISGTPRADLQFLVTALTQEINTLTASAAASIG